MEAWKLTQISLMIARHKYMHLFCARYYRAQKYEYNIIVPKHNIDKKHIAYLDETAFQLY